MTTRWGIMMRRDWIPMEMCRMPYGILDVTRAADSLAWKLIHYRWSVHLSLVQTGAIYNAWGDWEEQLLPPHPGNRFLRITYQGKGSLRKTLSMVLQEVKVIVFCIGAHIPS